MRLIIEYMGARREYPVGPGTTLLGRDPACDIVIPDPRLSRRHLECKLDGDKLVVRDLGTKNGTYLGARRIEEAHLPPGVALRAGKVSLLLEAEEGPATKAITPEELPRAKAAEPAGDLESRVPAAEEYEEEEEPTPAVVEMPPATATEGAAEEARVVVRDNRWYLRDPATGAEVEIVPVQPEGGGAGAPQPPLPGVSAEIPAGAPAEAGAQLPARYVPRPENLPARPAAARLPGGGGFGAVWSDPKRRLRLLVAALIVFIVVVAITVYANWPRRVVAPLSRDQYAARADADMAPFAKAVAEAEALSAAGKNEEASALVLKAGGAAVHALLALQKQPAAGSPGLAEILIEALRADAAFVKALDAKEPTMKEFADARDNARQHWQEVATSSESTQSDIKLAQARMEWAETQARDMLAFVNARQQLGQGQDLQVIQTVGGVASAGALWSRVQPLVQQATDAIIKTASDQAAKQQWTDAAATLNSLVNVRPDLADSLAPKIKEYGVRDQERKDLQQAANLATAGKYDEAQQILAQIPADSPYRTPADGLAAGFKQKQAVQLATTQYNAGNGEQALDTLSKAGLGNSPDVQKIQAVIKLKAQAVQDLKDNKFMAVKADCDGILRLESPQKNAYAQWAKNTEAQLPDLTKAGAQLLVDEATEIIANKKDYLTARQKFEEALRLDPANQAAKDRLKQFAKDAGNDFYALDNRLRQQPPSTPAEFKDAFDKLKSVSDRLDDFNDVNDLRGRVATETKDLQALQAKLGAGANP